MADEQNFVNLGLSCRNVCKALKRGMNGRTLDDFSKSACDAINLPTTNVESTTSISSPSVYRGIDRGTVTDIQEKVVKRNWRYMVSQFIHSRDDEDAIARWKSDLNGILHVFNVCSLFSRFVATNYFGFRLSRL